MQSNAVTPPATEPEAADPEETDKGQRQALYLAYRAISVDSDGKRMNQAAAARLAGISSITVTHWKHDNEQFRANEREAIRNGVGQARKLAKAGVWSLLGTAIYQLSALLRDTNTPPSVKAQMAIKLLEFAGASAPTEIEVSGDPWGALLRELVAKNDEE